MVVRAARALSNQGRRLPGRSRSYLPRQCCSCCNHRLFVRSSSARGLAQVPTALSRPSRSDRPTVPPLKLPQQQRQLSQGQAATLITWRAFSGSPRGDKSRVEGRRVATAAAAEEEEDGEERARAWAKAGVSEEVARTSGRGVPNLRDKGEKTNRGAIDSESSRVWTVPNIITTGRICFCPVLAGLIVTSQHELALGGLLVASLSDWLDGYIARRWNQKSVLGGFLDPLADKIMVTTVALALGQQGIIPASLVTVMVGRDALLIAGSLVHRYRTRREGDAFFDFESIDYKVAPSTLSKVNTALQFGTLWLGLTNAVYLIPGDGLFFGLCAITGVATLASGANYLLVSGLKPKGKLGKRLMIQRENLQERYREREVLMRKRMDVRRERMRLKQGEFNDKINARRKVVAGALQDRIRDGTQSATATKEDVRGRIAKGRVTLEAIVAKQKDRARAQATKKPRTGVTRGTSRDTHGK